MDRLDAMQLFARIVELGSFSRAAEAMDLPRATATHAIKALEARLGVRLLERTTRSVRSTPEGDTYYRQCIRLLAELEATEHGLRGADAEPSGTLRVAMQGTQATHIVLPHIDDFRSRYPRLDVVLHCGDRKVQLLEEGFDCAIRAGRPADSSLKARALAKVPEVVCASPAYLREHGTPRDLDSLQGHRCVGFFNAGGQDMCALEFTVDGQLQALRLPHWIAVNEAEAYVTCALRGAGLIQLPRYHVAEHLAAGTLVEVLADVPRPGVPVYGLYPQHREQAPRVRAFLDWVAGLYGERFGAG
ncbi:LysR family transcriptional regulator [Oleiagrimonas sp. C23AA]|uniref:LysR family transcriptional regulator n=1 Tax=Oleiagrimonas sp. C23AA TaxID=2719047 RepID=UPI001423EB1E|nr:LysR family transcriptional regulator [Oleiagrimonas sp. C23AA]NII09263.1 LysR family transcriptional regulator [Oleiagrimonas sp. C23AA]